MASVYQGKYTFPVASTAERSMLQGATAQAQMYAGLGQMLGRTFGDAIGKYFDVQDEKKAAESMAENQIALDVMYQGRDVPADREQRIKDARGLIKASGGFKNFLGRIETERANQRADRAEALNKLTQERLLEAHKQNVALGEQRLELERFQLGAAKDAATTREAGKELAAWMFKEKPGELTPEGQRRRKRFDAQEKLARQGDHPEETAERRLDRERIYSRILAPHRKESKAPIERSSEDLARLVSEDPNLSTAAKAAARKEIQAKRAEEMAGLEFQVKLGNLGLTGQKSREEYSQLLTKPVNELRDDFTKEKPVVELDEVKVSFDKVRQSAATATPAGDIQLIFSFMKVLDPGSIVRDSEFKLAGDAGDLPTRIQNWYDKIVGGTGLQTKQRNELVRQAKIAANAQLKTVAGKIDFYKKLAKTRGIKIEQIIPQNTLDLVEEGFPGPLSTGQGSAPEGTTMVGKFEVTRGGQPPSGGTLTIEEAIAQVDAQNVPPSASAVPAEPTIYERRAVQLMLQRGDTPAQIIEAFKNHTDPAKRAKLPAIIEALKYYSD
jgi:hypothetical protein